MILHSVCSIVHSRLSCGKRMKPIALPCSGLRVVVPWRETDTASRSFLSRPQEEQRQAIAVNSAYVLHFSEIRRQLSCWVSLMKAASVASKLSELLPFL